MRSSFLEYVVGSINFLYLIAFFIGFKESCYFVNNYLTLIGLSLNFIGTILIAFAISKNIGGAYQEDAKGNKLYLVSLNRPDLFIFGIVLVALGFVFQLIKALQ